MGVRAHGADGLSLIEVMVAVLMLAVVLSGAVDGVLRARARVVAAGDRAVSAGFRSSADDRAVSATWMWGGAQVTRAEWISTDTLDVWIRGGGNGFDGRPEFSPTPVEATVGAWVDGWYVAEVPVSTVGATRIGAGIAGCDHWTEPGHGAEVILRVRLSEGAWGVPWRTVVPVAESSSDVGGIAAGAGEPLTAVDSTATEVPTAAGLCVHRPSASPVPAGVDIDGDEVPLGTEVFGDPPRRGPLTVPLAAPGTATVTVRSSIQALSLESGSWVDVYF